MPYNTEMVCILFCMYWAHTGFMLFLAYKYIMPEMATECIFAQLCHCTICIYRTLPR